MQRRERLLRVPSDPERLAVLVCEHVRAVGGGEGELRADVGEDGVAGALEELFEAENAEEPAHEKMGG